MVATGVVHVLAARRSGRSRRDTSAKRRAGGARGGRGARHDSLAVLQFSLNQRRRPPCDILRRACHLEPTTRPRRSRSQRARSGVRLRISRPSSPRRTAAAASPRSLWTGSRASPRGIVGTAWRVMSMLRWTKRSWRWGRRARVEPRNGAEMESFCRRGGRCGTRTQRRRLRSHVRRRTYQQFNEDRCLYLSLWLLVSPLLMSPRFSAAALSARQA